MRVPQTDLHETRLSGETVFKGKFLEIHRDLAHLPDGRSGIREYIRHPGAVVVVPLLDDGSLVLERQFRYPMGCVMVEFPAGKLDAGEAPSRCGQRELFEETGYRATEWAVGGVMHNAIGYSDEAIHVHFARGLHLHKPSLDEGEFVEVFTAKPAEISEAIRRGWITDAKTITAMYWLDKVLRGEWSLNWLSVNDAD